MFLDVDEKQEKASSEIMGKVKALFSHMWEFIRFVLLTPSWGSKRRAEQRAYEDRLDEPMSRSQSEQ